MVNEGWEGKRKDYIPKKTIFSTTVEKKMR